MSLADQLRQKENETSEQYKVRLLLGKEDGLIEDLTWQDVADMLDIGPDYARRLAKGMAIYRDALDEEVQNTDAARYAQRELIRTRDERTAYNKDLRSLARMEQKLDYLEECIREIGKGRYKPIVRTEANTSTGTVLLLLSDMHIGATYNSPVGKYNSDIARLELAKLHHEVLAIRDRHKCNKLQIALLGDQISGSIHKSIAVTNREDTISQVMLASELIADFVYGMCQQFDEVRVNSVNGNHSRIDRKDDALKSERLDRIIPWFVRNALDDVENLTVVDPVDPTIDRCVVEGHTFLLTHGDFDGFTDSDVKSLIAFTGEKPYGILFAHKHFPAFMDSCGVLAIQGGTLQPPGDDYSFGKRLLNRGPSQTVAVMKPDGLECIYPVDLTVDESVGDGFIA